jgi:benzoate/toluate 1,2-dioxygenase beta subunit
MTDSAINDLLVWRFLFHEARLMDEHRYAEWLDLYTEDAVYWVPCNGEGTDPEREVSFIYDNRARLADRIARFESGTVLAQLPRSKMRRVVSNIEINRANESEFGVTSNFVLVEARGSQQYHWAGQVTHRLRTAGDGFKIRFKKIVLVNNDQEVPSLQFLV